MATGCLRKMEKINICIKLTKMEFLVTDENMGLCLDISHLMKFKVLFLGGGITGPARVMF